MEAIRYLKFQGVAHRDMKPENMMIDLQTGNIKVIDFGVCRSCKPNEQMQWDKSGTPKYYPWEVLVKGDVKYDAISGDLFSTGISMLETINGCYPLK